LYVSDYYYGRIYKYSISGSETLFKSGLTNPAGMVFDSQGNLFVACRNDLIKITPDGITSPTFATASSQIYALAIDATGNIYASDFSSNIYKFNSAGSVSTFVSSGVGRVTGLAFNAQGTLFALSYSNRSILQISPTGSVSTYLSGLARILNSLTFDANGNLYFADLSNGISKVLVPSICNSGTMQLMVSAVNGIENKWFAAASGGTALITSDTYTTPTLTSPSTFYVESRNTLTGCISTARTPVIAPVNGLQSASGASTCPKPR
jgi:hypothetical protein